MRFNTKTSMVMKPDQTNTATATTVADFGISTLSSLFTDLLTYAIEFARSIPSLAKRSWAEAWRFVVQKLAEEKDKVKLVVAVFVAVAIGFVFVKLCRRCCCCCGSRGRMMKAPGRGGAMIRRNVFVGNPRGYFRDLRSRP